MAFFKTASTRGFCSMNLMISAASRTRSSQVLRAITVAVRFPISGTNPRPEFPTGVWGNFDKQFN